MFAIPSDKCKKIPAKPTSESLREGFQANEDMESKNAAPNKQDSETSNTSRKLPLDSLKFYAKHYKSSNASLESRYKLIEEQVYTNLKSNAKKDKEIAVLKHQVNETNRKNKELMDKLSAIKKEHANLKNYNITAKGKYFAMETDYNKKINNMNLIVSEKSAKLKASYDRMVDLKKECEAYRATETKYKTELVQKGKQIESHLQRLEHIENEKKELVSTFEEHIQKTDAVYKEKCEANEKRMEKLLLDLKNSEEEKKKLVSKFEEDAQKTESRLKMELQEKEAQIESILQRHKNAEDEINKHIISLKDEKLLLSKKINEIQEINNLKEDGLSRKLKDTESALLKERESKKLESQEREKLLSVFKNNLENAYTQCQEKEKELMNVRDELNKFKQANESLNNTKETMMKKFLANEERYLKEIHDLQNRVEQLISEKQIEEANAATITDLNNRLTELTELEAELQRDKNKNIAEIDSFKSLLAQAQDEIKHLDLNIEAQQSEMVKMEREKNNTIAELQYKLNQLGNVFSRSVQAASLIQSQQAMAVNAEETVELVSDSEQPVADPSTTTDLAEPNRFSVSAGTTQIKGDSSKSKLQRNPKVSKPLFSSNDFSDFDDDSNDSDNQINLQFKAKKNLKRVRPFKTKANNTTKLSSFDILKRSKP